VSIDSSDGVTSDAVYTYVRRRLNKGYLAIKGASNDDGREIFAPPKPSIDTGRQHKHTKHGLKPYIVGTSRAKDLLLEGRLQLTGGGPGRLHWYRTVRPDYWEQLTSEVKIPHRTIRNKKVWAPKSGVRNEVLDAEVYCLHAARSLKLNLYKESRWLDLEQKVRQAEIFIGESATQTAALQPAVQTSAQPKPAIQPKPAPFNPARQGFSASRW
jgi:phage terminase large subunit GpA-like protein